MGQDNAQRIDRYQRHERARRRRKTSHRRSNMRSQMLWLAHWAAIRKEIFGPINDQQELVCTAKRPNRGPQDTTITMNMQYWH
jgi:hypothetical protein